jgi:hypothetical protein
MMDFVSWDGDIPNISGKKNVPNHQPGKMVLYLVN